MPTRWAKDFVILDNMNAELVLFMMKANNIAAKMME